MTTLFRLDASIRIEGSVTRAVADAFQTAAAHRLSAITHREVGTSPLPADAWRNAALAELTPPELQSPEQRAARRLATVLADEVAGADILLLAIPLYNFGVAQQAKAWMDLLLTEPRLSPKAPKLLHGRRAILVTAKGGGYSPGTPRHGWDHSTPWLLRILRDVWELQVQSIEVELTLADVNPAMAALRPMAKANLDRALREAAKLGQSLGRQLAEA